MITTVQSIQEVPQTHSIQMKRIGKYFKCPVTGRSRTTVMKVLTMVNSCHGYLVAGCKMFQVFYDPSDIKNNSEKANRVYEEKYGNKKNSSNDNEASFSNLKAARDLYVEALKAELKRFV